MKSLYIRLFAIMAVGFISLSDSMAQSGPAFYSNTGLGRGYRTCTGIGILTECFGEVSDVAKAVDNDFNSYAVLRPPLALFPVSLRMVMSGVVPKNYRAGVVISRNGVSALGAVVLRTYLRDSNGEAQFRESKVVTGLATAALGNSTPGRVEFVATEPFDVIEIETGAVVNLAALNVHYAYGIDANVVEQATGVLSRTTSPVAGTDYSSAVVANGVTVCVSTGVANPQAAADASLTNAASFNSLFDVSCPSTLRVKLEKPAPAGYHAGFVIDSPTLLDVDALSSLRITTYKNGVPQETALDPSLLRLTVLPSGKQQISFPTTQAFDAVEITRTSALGLLNNLNIYYGFGLEPSVFVDTTPVRSDFSNTAGKFEVFSDGLLCLGCANVQNPERAVDSNMGPNDFAEIRTGLLNVGTSTALRMSLNGPGRAGNTAGVVINSGGGLLNTQLLGNIKVKTYGGPDGNTLLETASGDKILSQSLLSNGRVELSFLTTQDFSRIELEVDNTLSVLDRTQVFYAFAEDRPTGFPTTVNAPAAPLPVELVSFVAKANGPAVDLNWTTATERNSSHFVVERALNASAEFRAIGRVSAAGSSAKLTPYQLRDQEAATQNAPVLYYRLRQVDFDGKESLSPVASVKMPTRQLAALEVYPNPAATSGQVQVRLPGAEGNASHTLSVFDVRGALLREVSGSQSVLTIEGEALPAGLYNLVLTNAAGQRLGSQHLVVTGR